jgi:ArsR family transcriptional regulator, arsenate/arsenite/antimonite-responsive transcriptional repressor
VEPWESGLIQVIANDPKGQKSFRWFESSWLRHPPPAMQRTDDDDERIGKALADAQRLRILEAIAGAGELSCAALCERFPVSQATISHHLKELAGAGLVTRRREGQYAIFSFQDAVMAGWLARMGKRLCVRPPRRAVRAKAAARR